MLAQFTKRLRGATVARLTPDQKAACSNHVGVKITFDRLYDIFWYVLFCIPYAIIGLATVAEWLRRLTRNQIPYGSAGLNPAGCENFKFVSIEF